MPFIPDSQTSQRTGFVPDKKSLAGFGENVVKSGGRFLGDTASSLINVINPNLEKNTLANLVRLGGSVISLALPGEQGNEDLARQVGQYYAQRYGGLDNAWNSFYNDPVGVAADISTVLGGAGLVAKGLKLGKASNTLSTASRLTDPLQTTSRLMSKVPVKSLFSRVGKGLQSSADDLVTKGLGNPAKQADLARKSGKTVPTFIDQYNLYDRSPDTARAARYGILNQYDDLALRSGKSLPLNQVLSQIDDQIRALMSGPSQYSDANKAMIAELTRRKGQLLEMAGGGSDIGIEALTQFRRQAIDPDIPQSMFNLDARGSGTARGAKQVRDILKANIDSSDPRLSELGRDYGMAKGMEDIFRKAQSRANNRQLLNMGGVSKAGVGGLIGGLKGAAVGYATDLVTNNPRFLEATSKGMRSAGRTIESAKLPPVPAWMKTGYQAGRGARLVSEGLARQPEPQYQAGGEPPQVESPVNTPSAVLKSSPYIRSLPQPSKVKPPRIDFSTTPFRKVRR